MDQDGARLSDQDIVGPRTIVGAVVIQELREPVDLDGVLLDAGGNLVVRLLLRAAPVLEHAVVGPVSAFARGNPGSNGGLHFAQAVVPLRQPRSIYVAVAPASKVHLAEVKRAGVLQDLFVVPRLWSQPLHVTAGKGMKSDVRAKNRDTGSFRRYRQRPQGGGEVGIQRGIPIGEPSAATLMMSLKSKDHGMAYTAETHCDAWLTI
jgi:hypothetical protein